MDALMSLLGKSSSEEAKKPPAKPETEGETASGDLRSPEFEAGAQEVFEALEAKDFSAFADALKACIEMSR